MPTGYFNSDTINGLFYEPGYSLLVSFVNKFNLHYSAFFVITSFLTWYNFLNVFKKIGILVPGAFLLFFSGIYFDSFNTVRQYMSLSFLCSAYFDICDDNRFKALLKILLAFSFHFFSLIFIPIIFFSFIKRSTSFKKIYLVIGLFIIALFLFVVIYADALLQNSFFVLHDFSDEYDANLISGLTNTFILVYSFLILVLIFYTWSADYEWFEPFVLVFVFVIIVLKSMNNILFLRFTGFYTPIMFGLGLYLTSHKKFLKIINWFILIGFFVVFIFKHQAYLNYDFVHLTK